MILHPGRRTADRRAELTKDRKRFFLVRSDVDLVGSVGELLHRELVERADVWIVAKLFLARLRVQRDRLRGLAAAVNRIAGVSMKERRVVIDSDPTRQHHGRASGDQNLVHHSHSPFFSGPKALIG